MRPTRHLIVAAMLIAGLVAPPAASAPTGSRARFDRGAEDCTQATPAAVELPINDQDQLRVDVEVLLDGVALRDADATMKGAATAYAPLEIKLVPSFRTVVIPADGSRTTSSGTRPAADLHRVLMEAKALSGGTRPDGADVVYLMTSKDLFTYTDEDSDGKPDESERSYGIAGLADCIGGVRYPNRAFAVGEFSIRVPVAVAGAEMFGTFSEKVAAHEIGHLFGAQHHLSDCAEGVANEVRSGSPIDAGPCTLMFNDIGLSTLHFSSLNGPIVRGHTRYLP